MKITQSQLKQIIAEELESMLGEVDPLHPTQGQDGAANPMSPVEKWEKVKQVLGAEIERLDQGLMSPEEEEAIGIKITDMLASLGLQEEM